MTVKLSTIVTLLGFLLAGLSGCSLMHDDLAPCPSGVNLHFVYDYNIQRADMFHAHVGGVTVYVFDEEGRFVTRQEESNTATRQPLAEHDYHIHLDLTPGTYSFIALAHQKSYNECLAAPGAKYRRNEPQPGMPMNELGIVLDREEHRVPHQGTALDTLWHGMSSHPLVVKDMEEAKQTISLMRDTKELTVSLHQLDDPADIDASDFDIRIEAANGRIAYDNSLPEDETLTYTPYATWNTEFTSPSPEQTRTDGETDVLERTAHAALSFNRLIYHSPQTESPQNALLVIRNLRSGKEVARINLPDCLAQGRGAFAFQNYSPQEFLDREYEYKLDFFLRGDTWQYIDLSISILSWSKRIQRVDL